MVASGQDCRLLASLVLALTVASSASSWAQPLPEVGIDDGQTLSALHDIFEAASSADAVRLARYANDVDPLVRAALCRVLLAQPDLAASDVLMTLADDQDLEVAALAHLALVRSPSPDALDILERSLSSPEAARREASAVAIALRAAIARDVGILGPSDDLQARARPQIISEAARRWAPAIDYYERLRVVESQWFALHSRLGSFGAGELERDCARRVWRNPGLLSAVELSGRPQLAVVRDWSERPEALLLTGQHDALADQLFVLRDELQRLERVVERVEAACTGYVPVEATFVWDQVQEPPSGRESRFEGFVGLGLGFSNHPFAYRAGSGDFTLGEDLEITFMPALELSYYDALDPWALQPIVHRQRQPDIIHGWGAELDLGALFSSNFFDDRSRPTASARVGVDTLDPGLLNVGRPDHGFHLELEGGYSAGGHADAQRLDRFPAPYAFVGLSAEYLRLVNHPAGAAFDRRLGLVVDYVEHVTDDASSPPRDRRWLAPELSVSWVFGGSSSALQFGLNGDARVRTDEDVAGLAAVSSQLAPLMRWNQREVHLDLSAGLGITYVPDSPDEVTLEPIGRVQAVYADQLDEILLEFEVGLERSVQTLSRVGYAGVSERAEARVSLLFTDAMRERLSYAVFAERAEAHDTGDAVAWGGLEVYIPVSLHILSQELSYVMRYVAVIDEGRFENRAQEVFEALLRAGTRF